MFVSKHVIGLLLLNLLIDFAALSTDYWHSDMCLHSAIIHGSRSLPCLNVCTILQLVVLQAVVDYNTLYYPEKMYGNGNE